jgi:molybdopterin synthase sulfur carrier subunit
MYAEQPIRRALTEDPMPAIEVRVPPVLRKFTTGANSIRAEGSTIAELLENLDENYHGLKTEIVSPDGSVHRFINIYRNGEDIRYLERLDTPLKDGDVIAILPAVAGG